jgi:hypothetical protein
MDDAMLVKPLKGIHALQYMFGSSAWFELREHSRKVISSLHGRQLHPLAKDATSWPTLMNSSKLLDFGA